MFTITREEVQFGEKKVVIETGLMARQASGSAVVTCGQTTVLATVVVDKKPKLEVDFFPLSVHYQEKAYAAGKIPGGFFKREGRPTESEILTSRLIDRPVRPMFVEGFKNETQVMVTLLSYDGEEQPDVLAIIATSAALTFCGAPFMGPICAARVGLIQGEYVLNPTVSQMKESKLDLVVAGKTDSVLMVESEAKELSEEDMLGAVMFGQKHFAPVIQAIINMARKCAKDPMELAPSNDPFTVEDIFSFCKEDIQKAYSESDKVKRVAALAALKEKAIANFAMKDGILLEKEKNLTVSLLKEAEKKVVRGALLATGTRIDGRDTKTVRSIASYVGVLPRAHGSALFTRGETQSLGVVTLGSSGDEQLIDSLDGEYKERFMLHYNFPAFSVGEVGRVGATGRREVGHGKLAWRALHPLLPSKEEFPYAIRIVSEILESNGSSSMATVCSGALALMDAGVPIARPASGIAMGLIKEGDNFVILSDILGDEDHLGDMDFKVAGTSVGITALQMDIKIAGITQEIMQQALAQAKDGRAHILQVMSESLSRPRESLGEFAPKIESMTIPTDKIREVIGKEGKVIRAIQEETNVKIDINDDGTLVIYAANDKDAKRARDWVHSIVAEPEANQLYEGTVVRIMEFGAFVRFFGQKEGLVHVSQIAEKRVEKVEDFLQKDVKVMVRYLGVDEKGRSKLTMKGVQQPA